MSVIAADVGVGPARGEVGVVISIHRAYSITARGVGCTSSHVTCCPHPVTSLGIPAPPAASLEPSGVHRQSPSYKMEGPSSGLPHLSHPLTHAI